MHVIDKLVPSEMIPYWNDWNENGVISFKSLEELETKSPSSVWVGVGGDHTARLVTALESRDNSRLKQLVVDGQRISEKVIAAISRVDSLTHLQIQRVSGSSLSPLSNLGSLSTLCIGGGRKVRDFSFLSGMHCLRAASLSVTRENIDSAIESLPQAVVCLFLDPITESDVVSVADLPEFNRLTNLRYLMLNRIRPKTRSLGSLPDHQSLQSVLFDRLASYDKTEIGCLESRKIAFAEFAPN